MYKKYFRSIAVVVAFVFMFSVPFYTVSTAHAESGHQGHFEKTKSEHGQKDVYNNGKQDQEKANSGAQDHVNHEKQEQVSHGKQKHEKVTHEKQHKVDLNKGKLKRADSISKRLDSIEAEINAVTAAATTYFAGDTTTNTDVQSTDQSSTSDTQSDTSSGDTNTVQPVDTTNELGISGSQGDLAGESELTVTSDPVEVDPQLQNEIQDTEDTETGMEDIVADGNDESYFSFFGKLNAQLNKLNAIKKQLYHLQKEGVGEDVISSLSNRVDELENLALSEMETIVGYLTGNVTTGDQTTGTSGDLTGDTGTVDSKVQ